MANSSQAGTGLVDHDYNLTALTESCDEKEIEAMVEETTKIRYDHTPLPSLNPKKVRTKMKDIPKQPDGITNEVIFDAIQTLIKRFDEQDQRLKIIEKKMEENAHAVKENKEDIGELKKEIVDLRKENISLRQQCLEHARYKRRWDLRLIEDTRETVIGILTRVIPWSVEKLRQSVDTVHRLGKRNDAATNKLPRPVIIQFAMRTVRDEVWKKSREARVCKKMKIQFKEDFSKEDREARAKLWPKVQEARKKGKRAFLKEGYALIDGLRVDP